MTKICNCEICGMPVRIEEEDVPEDEICIGVLCDGCAAFIEREDLEALQPWDILEYDTDDDN